MSQYDGVTAAIRMFLSKDFTTVEKFIFAFKGLVMQSPGLLKTNIHDESDPQKLLTQCASLTGIALTVKDAAMNASEKKRFREKIREVRHGLVLSHLEVFWFWKTKTPDGQEWYRRNEEREG